MEAYETGSCPTYTWEREGSKAHRRPPYMGRLVADLYEGATKLWTN